MTKPLILVDGSSYFFRAFHALPPLTNSKGQPTGAVYGVVNMIKRLSKDYPDSEIVVVFDAKGKTFRDEWYPAYKAHRPAMPEELYSQFPILVKLLEHMGLPILTVEGVEADDVIGTLAIQASVEEIPVIISTGDKDMAQLVNEHITLINTMTNQILDQAGVKEKFGVTPEQIIDYLTLIGDTSDNIPGVTKCGPKTAVKWLSTYKTLDNLVANAHEIEGKIGEHLQASLAHLPLSKKLITIKTDLPLSFTIQQLKKQAIQEAALIEMVRELEFKSWLAELLTQQKQADIETLANTTQRASFVIINDENTLHHLLKQLKTCSLLCVDLETTNLDPICAEIVGIALAIDPEHPVYIPLKHQDGSVQLDKKMVLTALKPLLENPHIQKIGQNIKYDYLVFKNEDIELKGIAFDTMLESYLLNSTANRHDMDSLALKYLGHKTIAYKELTGADAQICFSRVPVAEAAAYAAEDAEITLKLHQTLYPLLDETLRSVFHEIEMPLVKVLGDMECHGVLIDRTVLLQHGERLKARIYELQEEAYLLAHKAFNLNSPKQLQEILFDELKLPILTKTPTGQPSTAEAVLQELAYEYRLPAVILEHRSLSKLVSTYIDALPRRINTTTLRVHTSYNQAVAATGRLSSSEPNLQNIPIRSEEGRLIRRAFIAPPEHVLIAADYSQIELRIMAHLSQDASLLKAFAHGWDIHAATASEMFATPLADITAEQRRRAKAVNFGLIYGMSSFGLAKQLGVSRQDAQYYMDCYFQKYPGVLEYMEQTRAKARAQGYVETLFGRRLYVPEINARNMMRQKAAERIAINAPMQGTAADIIKKAMLSIAIWQKKNPDQQTTMIMQVHDELVFEAHRDTAPGAKQTIQQLMEQVVTLSVPLVVSLGLGHNWDEAH